MNPSGCILNLENIYICIHAHIYTHIYIYINLFLAVLGLHCCSRFSLVVTSGGCSLVALCWLLTAVVSFGAEHRL